MTTRRNSTESGVGSSQRALLDDDITAAPKLNLSVAFLRADRRSPEPRIPAYRVGDRWLYDVPFIIETLRRQALQRPLQVKRGPLRKAGKPTPIALPDDE